MPLEILLPIVVVGITCIVLLIRWLRPTPEFRLHDTDQAAEIWNHRNHDIVAGAVHLNVARTHALIETGGGIGLVWVFGADPVTRLLDQPVVFKSRGNGLSIQTRDFTAPRVDVMLDGAEITHWTDILRQHP